MSNKKATKTATDEVPTTTKIHTMASEIRGVVINMFVTIEDQIDYFIRETTFGDPDYFDFIMDTASKGHISMQTKLELIMLFLDRYELVHKVDLTDVKDKIFTVAEKRNQLAHWVTDTSEAGIKLFEKKGKFRVTQTNLKTRKVKQADFGANDDSTINGEMLSIMSAFMDFMIDNKYQKVALHASFGMLKPTKPKK